MPRPAELTALQELVAALDRRIRHPGRADEQAISLAADELKQRALTQIATCDEAAAVATER